MDTSGEINNSMSDEVSAGFDSNQPFQNNCQVDFLGNKVMLHLKKKISQPRFEMLKQAMVSDLRKRILVLANEKAMDGTIAIPTVLSCVGNSRIKLLSDIDPRIKLLSDIDQITSIHQIYTKDSNSFVQTSFIAGSKHLYIQHIPAWLQKVGIVSHWQVHHFLCTL